MKPTHRLLILSALALASLNLISCAGNFERGKDESGQDKIAATWGLGGKGARIKTKTTTYPDGRTVVDADIYSYDNEKSFKDATSVPISGYRWEAAKELGKASLGTVEQVVNPKK